MFRVEGLRGLGFKGFESSGFFGFKGLRGLGLVGSRVEGF